MTFSKTFEIRGSKEIGLKFFGLVLSPFLKRGLSFASLHLSGNLASLMERLHICYRGLAKTVAPSFKKIPARLSKPAAFDGSIFFKMSKTLSSVISQREKDLSLQMFL